MQYIKIIQEEDKKKLVNLWLPLAIDMQGLNEVKNDLLTANAYYLEIRKELIVNNNETEYSKSLKSFPKFIEDELEEELPEWDGIKQELKNGYNNFDPKDLVNEIINKDKFSDFDKKYFSDPNFLPSWLQEVVTIINKKINESA